MIDSPNLRNSGLKLFMLRGKFGPYDENGGKYLLPLQLYENALRLKYMMRSMKNMCFLKMNFSRITGFRKVGMLNTGIAILYWLKICKCQSL